MRIALAAASILPYEAMAASGAVPPRAQRPAPSELDRIVVSHAGELRLGQGGMFDSCRNW